MPLIKKKISELPLADSLKGLYTIGYKIIDGIKTSVKVSLEDIQTAYQDVVNAIKKSEEATRNANNAAVTANEKASLANTAAANANDTAEHPTYIGTDHYVYKWNKTAQAYDKTDIYTKGDAFSIKKVYVSVAEMEADKGNPDIAEGDFALVNTGDVEDPDNAKLYVKAAGDYEFLVDMSGAIGFTGKTPQFSMGTVTTLEAGVSAIVTVSDDGTDDGGNPKYKINFAIPRGNPGAPFRVSGEYDTLEALKSAVPDGSAVDGFMAVGTEAPYDYYAWVNGEWVSQGKIAGGNVIVLPREILDLTGSSSSEEIFATFGGIDKYKDLLEKLSANNYLVQIGEPSLGSLRHIYTLVEYSVKFASNKQSGALSLNIYNEDRQLRRLHFYLEDNGTTARCGEASTFQLVKDSDVLTKTNTSPFTPTGDYQPATKKYADNINYGKVINVSVGTYLVTNKNEKDREAIDLINTIFGSVDNLKEIIQDIIANHTKYYFHSYNSKDNCIELSSIYSFHNPKTEEYNLQCNISYYTNNGPVSKRMGFKLMPNDEDCAASIEDILTSDNLQRVVKRTKTEYDSIGTKNEYTMYATTDA